MFATRRIEDRDRPGRSRRFRGLRRIDRRSIPDVLPDLDRIAAPRLVALACLGLLIVTAGCREGVLEGVNHAPVVQSIIATPTMVLAQQDVVLRAEATDEDGDGIRYFWSAEGGAFDTVVGESVRWTAPRTVGDYEVQVNASDRVASTTGIVRLRVVPTPQPAQAR